jgi:phage RecT family recombinase
MGADLRSRVVATRDQPAGVEKPKTLAEQIEAKKDVFQAALPEGAEARHLIRDAISLLRQNPNLAKCEVNTVLGGLMTFAQLGLRPGVLGHGWLIPFKKRVKVGNQWTDQWEAQVVIGYKGYAELIHRSAPIDHDGSPIRARERRLRARIRHQDRLVHKPEIKGPRGEIYRLLLGDQVQERRLRLLYMSQDRGAKSTATTTPWQRRRSTRTARRWARRSSAPGGTTSTQMAQKTVFLKRAEPGAEDARC